MEDKNLNIKYYTRNAMMAGIDHTTHVLLSQDRDGKKGNKIFRRVPKEEMKALISVLGKNQNLYEILPPDTAVKPYFDLEMEYEGLDQETMYDKFDLFCTWLMGEIHDIFGITLVQEDFVILNSCRTNKLSFHIVINEKMCFNSVKEQKIFISYLWGRFQKPLNDLEMDTFDKLSYTIKDEKRFIFDPIPYGNYQNIRLINQSKKGIPHTLKNVNQKWSEEDTLIRLYNGVGDRRVINKETLEKLTNIIQDVISRKTDKKESKKKEKNNAVTGEHQNITYKKEGLTIFEDTNLTVELWNKLPDYKRALYLIPNTSQHWQIYRNVGMAIRGANGSLEDFKKWAKLSTKYDKDDQLLTSGFLKFKKQTETENEHVYGLPYLRRLAKEAHPEFFRESSECLSKYFSLNTQGIKLIKESSKFVSQKGTSDEDNIFDEAKMIVLHAYLGRGNTTAIKKLLTRYKSFIFLSPRQTFARFIASEFECACYLDINQYNSEKLVISVESLWKLTLDTYDVVILDESESILNQFSSETLNGRQLQTWNILKDFIKNSKKVILSDAFLTNRSLDFVRSCNETTTMIQNCTPPILRKAEEIHSDVFVSTLSESIKAGDKNYVCYSSVNKLIENYANLQGIALENTKMKRTLDNAIVYHAKANDKVFESLSHINESWKKASLIITSPTNTIGCSYSPQDTEPDFNKVWVNAYPTCCVRDTFQTQMRVRHLKDNKMMFCLPKKQSLNFCKSRIQLQFDVMEKYEEFTKEKENLILSMIEELIKQRKNADKNDECLDLNLIKKSYEDNNNTPEDLRRVYFFNLFESTISIKHYEKMFRAFLEKCGYQTCDMIESDLEKDDQLPSFKDEDNMYENIKELNSNEMEKIQRMIETKTATENDKLQYEKYWFLKKINISLPDETKAVLFHEVYLKSHKRIHFDNALFEYNDSVVNVLKKDLRKCGCGYEMNKMNAVKLDYIKKLNSKLDIQSSIHSNQKITRESISDCISYLENERSNIHIAFGLKDWKKTGQSDFETTVKFIKKIYKNWTDMSLLGEDKNRKNIPSYYNTSRGIFLDTLEIDEVF